MEMHLLPAKVQKMVTALLTSRGHTSTKLRQAVEAYAARMGGATRVAAGAPLPENLIPYLTKVALYAYKVTDDDIEQLKQAGYSEDEIFEVTLSAALGASLARLERALGVLKGGR